MNEAVRESTQVEKKLEVLHQQNGAIENCWKDLYVFKERLNTLGKKVNNLTHPDTIEKTALSPTQNGRPEDPNTDGGLVGELQNIINVRQNLIYEFNNTIFPKLEMEINHLTNQI